MRRNKAQALDFRSQDVFTSDPSPSNRVLASERWLLRRLMAALGNPPVALILWDERPLEPVPGDAVGRITLTNRACLYRLLLRPSLHFGDDYAAGRIRIDGDLVRVLELIDRYRNLPNGLPRRAGLLEPLRRSARRHNSLRGSQDNIHHHYDLGNDFYRLWLDHEMQYTCAYYPDPALTLEQAQLAKLEHVCRKLRLKPNDRVLETGCGWGGLARYMARQYGVRVTAYNISREQVAYAKQRAAAEGLADQIDYVLDDYRNADGEYDAFVSVGMLEHVGRSHYRDLGRVIDRCLTPDGRGLIHTIGRNRPTGPLDEWIERRIFPGAYPPSLFEMGTIFEPHNFSILDVENLRLHYAKTLAHWLERFDGHHEAVKEQFGERFVRAWRLYLAGSQAAFRAGSLQLFQVAFARGASNEVPMSREHLYRAPAPNASLGA